MTECPRNKGDMEKFISPVVAVCIVVIVIVLVMLFALINDRNSSSIPPDQNLTETIQTNKPRRTAMVQNKSIQDEQYSPELVSELDSRGLTMDDSIGVSFSQAIDRK